MRRGKAHKSAQLRRVSSSTTVLKQLRYSSSSSQFVEGHAARHAVANSGRRLVNRLPPKKPLGMESASFKRLGPVLGAIALFLYSAVGLVVHGLDAMGLLATAADLSNGHSSVRSLLRFALLSPWWVYASLLAAVTIFTMWRFHVLTQPYQAPRIRRDNAEESLMFRDLAPIIRSYRTVVELAASLETFKSGMEIIEPSQNTHNDVLKIQTIAQQNDEAFSRQFRQSIIKTVSDIKTRHGIAHPNLADDRLTRPVFGPLGVSPLVEGLKGVSCSLRDLLAETARHLDV